MQLSVESLMTVTPVAGTPPKLTLLVPLKPEPTMVIVAESIVSKAVDGVTVGEGSRPGEVQTPPCESAEYCAANILLPSAAMARPNQRVTGVSLRVGQVAPLSVEVQMNPKFSTAV